MKEERIDFDEISFLGTKVECYLGMESTKDLQKSSTINIVKFYPNDTILPLFLELSNLLEDKNIFYTNLNNKSLKDCRVKKFYKHIAKSY